MYKLKIKRASASKQPAYMLKLMSQIREMFNCRYDKDELGSIIRPLPTG
jgi:hypothetical protein